MAINVKVPSDLSRVKEKVAFGLTKRQFVCFSLAALIGIPAQFSSLLTGINGNG